MLLIFPILGKKKKDFSWWYISFHVVPSNPTPFPWFTHTPLNDYFRISLLSSNIQHPLPHVLMFTNKSVSFVLGKTEAKRRDLSVASISILLPITLHHVPSSLLLL